MSRPNKGPYLRRNPRDGIWHLHWSRKGKPGQRSTGSKDLREAQERLAEFILEQRRERTQGPRDPADFPVIQALEDYAEEHGPEVAAPERIAYAIEALAPYWANYFAADINRPRCTAYRKHRGKSDGTTRRELGTLRAAINHAHRMGRISRVVHVFLPPKPPGKDRFMIRQEVAALLREAKASTHARLYLPLFVLLGIYTGARKEAILSLRWTQVDLERGMIDFNPPGRKQTTKKRPRIPIPRRLMTFLKFARRRGSDLGYVVHHDGARLGDIKKGFAAAALRAGAAVPSLREALFDDQGAALLDEDGRQVYRPTISPHTLRHTAGTWMAQRGVPLWDIAGYLGHSHERTTELYSHHHPDFLQRAREAFD